MTIGCSTTEIELASLARWTAVAPPIGAAERRARLAAAQERMTEIGAAALLVNAGPSLRYFTGVAWAPSERLVAMLLPAAGEPRIICPSLEQGSHVSALAIEDRKSVVKGKSVSVRVDHGGGRIGKQNE